MTRWTVTRHYVWSGELRPGWLVFGDYKGAKGKWFPTWREALDYADRRARTVEVVLPRGDKARYPAGFYLNESSSNIFITDGIGEIYAYHPDIYGLALALLAHHYKENQ